jgi:hypothetical protein
MSESSQSDAKDALVRLYTIHSPEKLPSVDALLEAYKGQEKELVEQMEAKYAPEPPPFTANDDGFQGTIAMMPNSGCQNDLGSNKQATYTPAMRRSGLAQMRETLGGDPEDPVLLQYLDGAGGNAERAINHYLETEQNAAGHYLEDSPAKPQNSMFSNFRQNMQKSTEGVSRGTVMLQFNSMTAMVKQTAKHTANRLNSRLSPPSPQAIAVLDEIAVQFNSAAMAEEHQYEGLLQRLWSALVPAQADESATVSDVDAPVAMVTSPFVRESGIFIWMGFQAENPDINFKTGGMLAARCLVYFAEHSTTFKGEMKMLMGRRQQWKFEQELAYTGNSSPQHTNEHGYPVALVGVQVVIMLADLFHLFDFNSDNNSASQKVLPFKADKEQPLTPMEQQRQEEVSTEASAGGQSRGKYNEQAYWPVLESEDAFYEIFCVSFLLLDRLWDSTKVTFGIAEFNKVLRATRAELLLLLEQAAEGLPQFVQAAMTSNRMNLATARAPSLDSGETVGGDGDGGDGGASGGSKLSGWGASALARARKAAEKAKELAKAAKKEEPVTGTAGHNVAMPPMAAGENETEEEGAGNAQTGGQTGSLGNSGSGGGGGGRKSLTGLMGGGGMGLGIGRMAKMADRAKSRAKEQSESLREAAKIRLHRDGGVTGGGSAVNQDAARNGGAAASHAGKASKDPPQKSDKSGSSSGFSMGGAMSSRLSGFKSSLFTSKDDGGAGAANNPSPDQAQRDQRLLAFSTHLAVEVSFKLVGYTAKSFALVPAHHESLRHCLACSLPALKGGAEDVIISSVDDTAVGKLRELATVAASKIFTGGPIMGGTAGSATAERRLSGGGAVGSPLVAGGGCIAITVAVWAGGDSGLANDIKACLMEIQQNNAAEFTVRLSVLHACYCRRRRRRRCRRCLLLLIIASARTSEPLATWSEPAGSNVAVLFMIILVHSSLSPSSTPLSLILLLILTGEA